MRIGKRIQRKVAKHFGLSAKSRAKGAHTPGTQAAGLYEMYSHQAHLMLCGLEEKSPAEADRAFECWGIKWKPSDYFE